MGRVFLVGFALLVVALGGAPASAAPASWADKTVDAEFDQADIRDAVSGIFDKLGVNYVLPDGLYGRVTARFTGLRARYAIDLLLQPRGWDVQSDGDVVRIVPRVRAVEPPAAMPIGPLNLEPAAAPAPGAPPQAAAPAAPGAGLTVGGTRLAVIRLRHGSPDSILTGGAGLAMGMGMGGGNSPFPGLGMTPGMGYGHPYGGAGYSYGQPGYSPYGYGYGYGQPGFSGFDSRGYNPGYGAYLPGGAVPRGYGAGGLRIGR